MAMDEGTWRIGDVATATGLTVRALHHYDQIGLVVPSERTASGHRLYTGADLRVLYQVTAMRQLGVPLEQIGRLLAEDVDVLEVLDEQLAQVDRQVRAAERLRGQLLAAREAGGVPDASGFLEITKLTQDLPGYLSREQIETTRLRMLRLGVVAEHAVGTEMPRLYADALGEMRAGTPSSDPVVLKIVNRLDELSEMLRGPDSSVGNGVREMWLERGRREPDQRGGAEWGALVGYLDEARAAR